MIEEKDIDFSKYYIPNINEFHVGFEYERRHELVNYNKKWESVEVIHTGNRLDYIETEIKKKRIRVKFLDEKDIESFEFKWINEISTDDEYKQGHYSLGDPEIGTWEIYWYSNTPMIITIEFKGLQLYWGHCMNKSELKRILERLGIIKWDYPAENTQVIK